MLTTVLAMGSLALTSPAAAESLNAYGHESEAQGNVLSVHFDSSAERTEIHIDRFMGTDPGYRFQRYHGRQPNDQAGRAGQDSGAANAPTLQPTPTFDSPN